MAVMLRRRLLGGLLLGVLAVALAGSAPAPPPAARILEHVRALSADEMEGRGTGTPGGERAARHIAAAFAQAGLQPGGDGGGYFQVFPAGTTLGTAANVVGLLPGTDPGRAVVVGAHYDHLGRRASDGAIYPGADDNASGTAVLLALARAIAEAGGVPRTLVFAAFAGEELGLLGSTRYVRQPPVPLERTALMINLDMVGRLREGRLHVGGVDSARGLRPLVEQAAAGLGLDLRLRGDPWAPSDHTSFYAAGVPVVFLSTGVHADYHRPGDTWDRVNASGLATVTAFAARLTGAAASLTTPPAYARLEPPARRGRAMLGVTPDFAEAGRPGVQVVAVRPTGPAERAGLRPSLTGCPAA